MHSVDSHGHWCFHWFLPVASRCQDYGVSGNWQWHKINTWCLGCLTIRYTNKQIKRRGRKGNRGRRGKRERRRGREGGGGRMENKRGRLHLESHCDFGLGKKKQIRSLWFLTASCCTQLKVMSSNHSPSSQLLIGTLLSPLLRNAQLKTLLDLSHTQFVWWLFVRSFSKTEVSGYP